MKFALLFPGQGSQKVGMGKDLENHPIGKEIFTQINKITKRDIQNIVLNGPKEELNQTKNTQIAITAVSVMLMQALKDNLANKKLSLDITGCCGHSLGEFTALWYSGLINTETLFKLVAYRGELMQAAPSGSMAAILNLTEDKINDLLSGFDKKIIVANYNSPSQFVISGEKDAFETLPETVKALGGKAIILPVSGAFHSHLMNEPSEQFSKFIDNTLGELSSPNIGIFQNIDGQMSTDKKIIIEKLKKQMTSSVLWTQTVDNLVKNKVTSVIEIGPGKVLTGLVKKINPTIECFNIFDLNSLNDFIDQYEQKLLTKTGV